MTTKLCVFAIIFLLLSQFVLAEGKTDFAGVWTLNKEKSELGSENRPMGAASQLDVKQTADTLTVQREMTNRNGEPVTRVEKLSMDGKKNEITSERGTRTASITWSEDGKTMTISSEREFTNQMGEAMKMSSTEKWSLDQDGKALSIDYVSSSPRGERTMKLVYDKKS